MKMLSQFNYRYLIVIASFPLFLFSCTKDLGDSITSNSKTKDGISPFMFDWSSPSVNWMPTPPGQSQISLPWIGQGSIALEYGLDVVNDHNPADGWQLLYSTFDPNASGPLVNPYIMLYNKYRGLLRIYQYITSTYNGPSSYIVDGFAINGPSSSMLNFVNQDIVDPSINQISVSHIEAAPSSGAAAGGANRWYMLQYEIAYDPKMETNQFDQIQLGWYENFNTITSINLGGSAVGTLNGTIGSATSPLSTALSTGGTLAGTTVLSALGSQFFTNNANGTGGANLIGLPPGIFSSMATGITTALSTATQGIPGAVAGILSAVLGGSSSSQTVSLNLNANVTLSGTQTYPPGPLAPPSSFWVPGSMNLNLTNSQGYVPLYNFPLGVLNISNRPQIKLTSTKLSASATPQLFTQDHTANTGYYYNIYQLNNASYTVQINKTIQQYVTVTNTEVLLPASSFQSGDSYYNMTPKIENSGKYTLYNLTYNGIVDGIKSYAGSGLGVVRLTLRVAPPGVPPSVIVKSFVADIIN